jgi:glycosyltransferase involved in cell wall biosynthesis
MAEDKWIMVIIKMTAILKPILVKLFPIELLRKVKKGIVRKMSADMNTSILPFDRNMYPDGINLIGAIRNKTGLGESCRLVAKALRQSHIELTAYNYTQLSNTRQDDDSCDNFVGEELFYNINIVHIQPHEIPIAYSELGKKTFDKHYNIAFWLWELEKFPSEYKKCSELFDEIWTPSQFVSNAIRQALDKPVFTIPYGFVTPNIDLGYSVKITENSVFVVLCMYDASSMSERKNPLGAIKAFKSAFPCERNENVHLVIKMNNRQIKDIERINGELTGYENYTIIAETLERSQVNALISKSDVFISLHRAEGFGLVLAEAMLLGTPVVATNWSATTEFMNPNTACLVDYELVEIEKDIGPYKKGWIWA